MQNLISLPHSVAELLKYVKKFKMAAVRHLNYYLAILDHPRSFIVDLKLVFKFGVERIYTCEDISDRTFRKFA